MSLVILFQDNARYIYDRALLATIFGLVRDFIDIFPKDPLPLMAVRADHFAQLMRVIRARLQYAPPPQIQNGRRLARLADYLQAEFNPFLDMSPLAQAWKAQQLDLVPLLRNISDVSDIFVLCGIANENEELLKDILPRTLFSWGEYQLLFNAAKQNGRDAIAEIIQEYLIITQEPAADAP